jgi:hypothetical protein
MEAVVNYLKAIAQYSSGVTAEVLCFYWRYSSV